MGLRTFTAPDGAEWRVWNVFPSLALHANAREWERRGQDVLAYEGPERRAGERRKFTPFVSPELASGWLCFEGHTGKRRLAPPPAGWEDAAERELGEYWTQAEPVPARKIMIPGIAPHRLP